MLLALGKKYTLSQAYVTVVHDGRVELQAQGAIEREIEAWDMSCRMMFLVIIAD